MVASAIDYAAAAAVAARRIIAARDTPPDALTPLLMAQRLDLDLDSWQRHVLTSSASQLLLNVTRQGGKSTVAALLGLATALDVDRSLVLVISPGERQSKLLFRKIVTYYRQLGKPRPAETENKLSLQLRNGSEIHALPGDTEKIRGFSGVSLLLVDEAARVPDDMMAAIRPMLAVSGGRMVAMSTPWGKRGWWYQAWSEGGDDWQRFEIPATACPRISPEFLAQERRNLSRLAYESEFECQFVEPDDAFFRYEAIERAFAPDLPTLFPLTPERADVA